MATIDVLLPVRNGLPYLKESIDSILSQTFSDWRLLVLDHGSVDGSAELASAYAEKDRRIELHSHPEADGLAQLLNIGLDKSDCRYVLRQDGDDVSLPQRFQLTLDTFSQEPDLFLVGSEATEIDAEGRYTGYLHRPGSSSAIFATYMFYSPISHPSIGLNFSALTRHGARYGRDFLKILPAATSIEVSSFAEDYFFFGQLALLGRQRNLKQPLIKYRIHGESISVSKRRAQAAYSIDVCRFLARSFCTMHGFPLFDPAPFNGSSGYIFDCGQREYLGQFDRLNKALRLHCSPDAEFERELAYREILAHRNSAQMLVRYLSFARRHGMRKNEWLTVRNWLLRRVPKIKKKYIYEIEGGTIA